MQKRSVIYSSELIGANNYLVRISIVHKKLKLLGGGCIIIGLIPSQLKDHPLEKSEDIDYVKNIEIPWVCLSCSKVVSRYIRRRAGRNFGTYLTNGDTINVCFNI